MLLLFIQHESEIWHLKLDLLKKLKGNKLLIVVTQFLRLS